MSKKFWCENCVHLLPLKNGERTENWKKWWRDNRKQFQLIHENGNCTQSETQIVKYNGK